MPAALGIDAGRDRRRRVIDQANTMKPLAARLIALLVSALLAGSLLAGSVSAAPNAAVSRVTDFYKSWLSDEGHSLKGRVRILLKPDRIFVQMTHDAGTTRLVFSADGHEFLGEYTLAVVARQEDRCLFRFLLGKASLQVV